jgi:hypothetical protein
MRWNRGVFAALLLLLLGSTAGARKRSGVEMPDRVTVAGKRLVLNGMGVREATVFNVNVYVAGLYLERPSSDPAEILASPQVMRIHMRFVRDVSRGDIVDAWNEGFAKNVGDSAEPALRERLARLSSWMTSVDDGDTFTFTWIPGKGTEVVVNGATKGVIPGDDFGKALFAIWLGPHPPNKGLKKGLLGK